MEFRQHQKELRFGSFLLWLLAILSIPPHCQSRSLLPWFRHTRTKVTKVDRKMSDTATATTTTTTTTSSQPDTTSNHQNYKEQQVNLDSGVSMKVTTCMPPQSSPNKPVLLFLHGSFHGGWCWTEKFFPFFVQKGYPVVALDTRGTGGTFAGEGVSKIKFQEYVTDLESLLDKLPSLLMEEHHGRRKLDADETKPILIAHSFASLSVMKMLELHPERVQQLRGIVMMCAVPPSGTGHITSRFLRQFQFLRCYKLIAAFAMKKCLTDASLCRELFFGGQATTTQGNDATTKSGGKDGHVKIDDNGVSEHDIARYQQYFTRDSKAVVDVYDLVKHLPSKKALKDGKAPYYQDLPPCMVLGASDDFMVDQQANEETARYFHVDKPCYVNSPHDVMLTNKWINSAEELEKWLESTYS